MSFLKQIVEDTSTLKSILNGLSRVYENDMRLALAKDFCNEFALFQYEYQAIRRQFELGVISVLASNNVHPNSYDEISVWVQQLDEFANTFQSLKDSLNTLQNILDSSCQFVYHLNNHGNYWPFGCAQYDMIQAFNNTKKLAEYLHLDLDSSTENTLDLSTTNYSHDSLLREALNLEQNYNSYSRFYVNSKHNLYKEQMKYDMKITWSILSDCYWFLLGSKLISFNAYLARASEQWVERKDTCTELKPLCQNRKNCERMINKFLQEIVSYRSALSTIDATSNNNNDIGNHCLSRYYPITSNCFNDMSNNLNIMICENNNIGKFICTHGVLAEHPESLNLALIKSISLFQCINYMNDNCVLSLNIDAFNYYSPVMYTTTLVIPYV
ncbi:unnamed protein product [Heterobilharzia americana]|nr:unnamed protein product [Heterobilharzia americana]